MISEPTMRTSSYGTALFLRFFITVKQDRLSNQVVKAEQAADCPPSSRLAQKDCLQTAD